MIHTIPLWLVVNPGRRVRITRLAIQGCRDPPSKYVSGNKRRPCSDYGVPARSHCRLSTQPFLIYGDPSVVPCINLHRHHTEAIEDPRGSVTTRAAAEMFASLWRLDCFRG